MIWEELFMAFLICVAPAMLIGWVVSIFSVPLAWYVFAACSVWFFHSYTRGTGWPDEDH